MVLVGLVAVAVAFVSLCVVHVVGRELSPVRRTSSEYVLLGPACATLFRIMLAGMAIAGLAVLVVERDQPVAVVSLILFAFGLLIAGFFTTDPVDLGPDELILTTEGRLHLLGAAVAFLSPVVAALAVGPVGTLPAQFLPLVGLLCLISGLVLSTVLTRRFGMGPVHGIGERLMVLATMAWLGVVLVAHL